MFADQILSFFAIIDAAFAILLLQQGFVLAGSQIEPPHERPPSQSEGALRRRTRMAHDGSQTVPNRTKEALGARRVNTRPITDRCNRPLEFAACRFWDPVRKRNRRAA